MLDSHLFLSGQSIPMSKARVAHTTWSGVVRVGSESIICNLASSLVKAVNIRFKKTIFGQIGRVFGFSEKFP